MKRKNHVFHLSVGVGLLLVASMPASAVEPTDVALSPDHFTNTLVVADESVGQTMVISNTGSSDLEFSFCPPPASEDGLVAHFPFNGNADDESGNGYDGTVNGATLTDDRSGDPNSAYLFDGVDDYVDIGNCLGTDMTPFTVSVWVCSTNAPSSGEVFIARKDQGSWEPGQWMMSSSTDYVAFIFNDYNGDNLKPRWSLVDRNIHNGIWHHLCGSMSSDGSKLYVDGELVASNTVSKLVAQHHAKILIGARADTDRPYPMEGTMDDVRIYNRALSGTEILDLYHESNPQGCTLPDWLSIEPMSGKIPEGASMEVAVTFNTSNMVAGDYVEHLLNLYGNGSAEPIGSVPVSMWVVPPAPVMVEEPAYTEGTSNELFWLAVAGPVEYWLESLALEHCSPGAGQGVSSDGFIPKGWSNVKRFHDLDRWMQESGWILSTDYLFTDLHLNTKYQYRVKASVVTDIGRIESIWSDWVDSCQVPEVRDMDESKVPDSWKQEHFGASENFHGLVDSDGDGLCDFDEYIAGALPFDAQSSFKVKECSTCADGHFILNWDSVPDRIYSVYWSESVGEPFQLLVDGICYPKSSYTDSVHNAESGGFYRIEVRLPE